MDFNAGHIGFLDEHRRGKSEQEFRCRQVEIFSQTQDVKGGEYYIDIAAAGGEAGNTRVTAEFYFTVQCVFLRKHVAGIFIESEKSFIILCHQISSLFFYAGLQLKIRIAWLQLNHHGDACQTQKKLGAGHDKK
ncbi:MAG: hypothetical protein M0P70_17570 [Desulfobulbaceae bacterium]|nr:hypothetical protein [Desulfobulbaceae bacterium]